jgi:N-acetylglucosamine malate deacetylase 2
MPAGGLLDVLGAHASGSRVPRTIVVSAHPDDETVGAASRLPRLRDARFVYVTDGAPRDGRDASRFGLSVAAYRDLRRRERESALARCGIADAQVLDFDCGDQQACFHLVELAFQMAELLDRHRIEAVLTHPYEGGHPDHDATAFIVHAASALLHSRSGEAPAVAEMTSYHAGPKGLTACEFLPDAHADSRRVTVVLTEREQQFKRSLFDCYESQAETLRQFPLEVERFRPAPAYDFRHPPHAGPLLYETHDWGMSGRRFVELAATALANLGLEEAP